MYKNLEIKSIGISGTQSELIELALSYRFQGMSLDMAAFARQVDEHGLPHARRLIDSARIRIGTFRLPVKVEADNATYHVALTELPKIAELAAALGCTRCVTTVEPATDQRPYHENFEFHRKRLAEIADVLKPHNIRLGLEFRAPAKLREGRAFQFIHTFDALQLLVKSTTGGNLGVVVDLWEMYASGTGLDVVKGLTNDQIVAVYLSDAPADTAAESLEETAMLLPGEEEGAIDSAAALVALAELGYDGPIIPRANRKALEQQSRDGIVKLAGERIDQLWKAAGLNAKGQLSAAPH